MDADPTGPTLDEEGIPDLQGPSPQKVATGDAQDGEPPPSARPASREWGVTAEEERRGEPLSVRVDRELPDVDVDGALGGARVGGEPGSLVLVDGSDEEIGLADQD